MSRRERRLDKTKNTKLKIKSIIRAFIILFILSAIFYMIYGWYKESKIKIVKNIDTKLTKIEAEENVIKIITEENEENKNYEKDIEKHKKSNLGVLEVGDKIYLSDNKYGKFSYTIYDKYRIEADDTSSISQDTDRREITLITCTSYSNKRLIIKARAD